MNQTDFQSSYFDEIDHQYSAKKILKPPQHVIEETSRLISKINSNSTVLDYGAGSGRLTIPLLSASFVVDAVDISQRSLSNLRSVAKKYFRKLKTFPAITKNTKYNTIVGADILHHVELKQTLLLLKSHLTKTGKVVFSEPNILNPSWFVYVSLLLDWRAEKNILYNNYYHLKKAFRQTGFSSCGISSLGLLPTPFFNKTPTLAKVNYWLGNLPILKIFAYRYLIEAFK